MSPRRFALDARRGAEPPVHVWHASGVPTQEVLAREKRPPCATNERRRDGKRHVARRSR